MISAEAVEAAAIALYERDKALIVPWGDTALPDRRAYMEEARAALEAAAPHMLPGGRGPQMSQTPDDFVTPCG